MTPCVLLVRFLVLPCGVLRTRPCSSYSHGSLFGLCKCASSFVTNDPATCSTMCRHLYVTQSPCPCAAICTRPNLRVCLRRRRHKRWSLLTPRSTCLHHSPHKRSLHLPARQMVQENCDKILRPMPPKVVEVKRAEGTFGKVQEQE